MNCLRGRPHFTAFTFGKVENMAFDSSKTAIEQLATPLDQERWRRRVLRSHREEHFTADDLVEIGLRDQLDLQLGKVARLELQAQVGESKVEKIKAVAGLEDLLKQSPAFTHYLDSYLYFMIRFAAGRFDPAPKPVGGENRSVAALPTPPELSGATAEQNQDDVAELFRLSAADDDPSTEINAALRFLDGYSAGEQVAESRSESMKGDKESAGKLEIGQASQFDLWLRGLLPEPADAPRFLTLARGLYDWASGRCQFYVSLERGSAHKEIVLTWNQPWKVMKEGEWHAHNPLAARCGVLDLYWLARVLRADVDPRGVVRYKGDSWLHRLPGLERRYKAELGNRDFSQTKIFKIEEILRAVFDYSCDLIQNAVEMAEYKRQKEAAPEDFPTRPETTADWRAAHDHELDDIHRQRQLRVFQEEIPFAPPPESPGPKTDQYWSVRVRTGEYQENLVGLALSGGGIRSATFGLGAIQLLKELDLLRRIDYLSTVSGGGYIGAWLLGNVQRTQYWLSPMTNWHASITHLRRFSKYLAPEGGILSADTWVIWGTWVRNALLIQLTAVTSLVVLLVAVLAGKLAFVWAGNAGIGSQVVLVLVMAALGLGIGANLKPQKLPWEVAQRSQKQAMVILAWVGSFLSGAELWKLAQTTYRGKPYSEVVSDWLVTPLQSSVFFGALLVLAIASVWPVKGWIGRWSVLVAFLSTAVTMIVAHLGISGVVYLFGQWASWQPERLVWYAYIFGPSLSLLAVTLSMAVFIGMVGRTSQDWRREWWTRFGSWLAIYGAGVLAVGITAVLAPVWIDWLWNLKWTSVKWGAVATWVASTIGGLLAGKSGQTKGDGGGSKILEVLARIGAAVFIVGAVLGVSTGLRLVMVKVWLPYDPPCCEPSNIWSDLNCILGSVANVSFSGWLGSFSKPSGLAVTLAILAACAALFCWRFNLNIFGLNQFYSNRLVRCYLGATRWMPGLREPHPFTGFDGNDDFDLASLHTPPLEKPGQVPFRGPFPIINCSLNLGGSSDLDVHTRQSASFTMTPLYAGSDRPQVGYAPVRSTGGDEECFADGVTLGRAISISGAAASPNMGHNTSPLVAVLLTMFNVRLAWWFPSPGRSKWAKESPVFSLSYLVWEFLGLADEKSNFVNVSDGGHFENLGIYELVRRRAKVIIACDAECDPQLTFESLGNAIRLCKVDFNANIELDVSSIRRQENDRSRSHCAVGRITYSNGSVGYLIYLKASITGDEETDIEQYRASHGDFPHETTLNQFFTEDQFESYRRLGYHAAGQALRGVNRPDNMVDMAAKLWDTWAPSSHSATAFLAHTKTLDGIWERFRGAGVALDALLNELKADQPSTPCAAVTNGELQACLQLLQLMENVFVDLRLDDYWDHPDNRGWAMLFTMWAKSPRFRESWRRMKHTFGIRFEYFCGARLGLEVDHPVARV